MRAWEAPKKQTPEEVFPFIEIKETKGKHGPREADTREVNNPRPNDSTPMMWRTIFRFPLSFFTMEIMTQAEKARAFADLHRKGDPVILYNVWDAGSAKTAESAGSKALATGSWPVAAAQGYEDGEKIPLDLVEMIVKRIVASVGLPLSVDFEGGYAEKPAEITTNVGRIIAAGAIGVNFEDKIVGTKTLYDVAVQAERIRAVRQAADAAGVPLFINARTDLFLVESDRAKHPALVETAVARAAAYKAAGASGFFAPGLYDEGAIGKLAAGIDLPLNIIKLDPAPPIATLKKLGVARISYGPRPYREMHAAFAERCAAALAGEG